MSSHIDDIEKRPDIEICAEELRRIRAENKRLTTEVSELTAKLEWIPWSEGDELPRPHTDVLILYEYDSIHGYRGVHITEDSRMNTGKWESESDVTHWMRLPDLPDSVSSSQEPDNG